MFCPKCGNEISESAMYCGYCGQKTGKYPQNVSKDRQETIERVPQMFCPQCGSPLYADDPSCTKCGWTAAVSERESGYLQEGQATVWVGRRIKWLLAVLGFCLVVVIVVTICLASPKDISGTWENIHGDSVIFYEDGSCEMATYTLESIIGRSVHYASRMMYDLKSGKKIEITYVGEHGLESIRFDYDLETKNGERYLVLGTEIFMCE